MRKLLLLLTLIFNSNLYVHAQYEFDDYGDITITGEGVDKKIAFDVPVGFTWGSDYLFSYKVYINNTLEYVGWGHDVDIINNSHPTYYAGTSEGYHYECGYYTYPQNLTLHSASASFSGSVLMSHVQLNLGADLSLKPFDVRLVFTNIGYYTAGQISTYETEVNTGNQSVNMTDLGGAISTQNRTVDGGTVKDLNLVLPIGLLYGGDDGFKYDVFLNDDLVLKGEYYDNDDTEANDCSYSGDYYKNKITSNTLDYSTSCSFNENILLAEATLQLKGEYMRENLNVKVVFNHFHGNSNGNVITINAYETTLNTAPTFNNQWIDLGPDATTVTVTETGAIVNSFDRAATVSGDFARKIGLYKKQDGDWSALPAIYTYNETTLPEITIDGYNPVEAGEYDVYVYEYSATGIHQFEYGNKTFTTLPIQAPTNVMAKNVGGGNVRLSWEQGSTLPWDWMYSRVQRRDNPGDTIWENAYHHNGSQWAINYTNGETVGDDYPKTDDNYSSTTFIDMSADPTKTYEYRVYNYMNSSTPYEDIISNGSGLKNEDVPIVTNLTATNNECRKITLNWNTVSPPGNLSTNESFSVKYYVALESDPYNFINTVGDNVDFTATNFVFEEPEGATESSYTFRVYTVLDRAELEGSSTKEFVFYDRYSTVTGTYITEHPAITGYTLSQDNETSGVKITWNPITGIPTDDLDIIEYTFINDQNSSTAQTIAGNSSDIQTDNGISYYIDNANLEACTPYNYKIRTNYCSTVLETEQKPIILTQNSEGTFSSTKNLSTSKGYYPDRVQLSWDNNNNAIVDRFKILRRVYVDEGQAAYEFVEIGEVSNATHTFIDEYAQAGELYEYQIKAVFSCITDEGVEEYSYKDSDIAIGFRMPDGAVSGHIEYEGGNSVKDVKVVVQATEETINRSLYFNGSNSYVDIASFTPLIYDVEKDDTDDSYTFSAWVKTKDVSDGHIFAINTPDEGPDPFYYGDNITLLEFYSGTLSLYYKDKGATTAHSQTATIPSGITLLDNWHHVALSYSDETDTVKVYLNSELVLSVAHESFVYDEINSRSNLISIGQEWDYEYGELITSEEFHGYMDEIRIWNSARTQEQIANTYNRYLKKNEEGLIAAYHCDEGLGDWLYDTSKNDNQFNKNDGQHHNMAYSDDTPTSEQIGNVGLTDENGNYIIEAIRYVETGNNFTVTPMTVEPYYETPHEFEPSQRVVFIGDGAVMQDGQNFTDISAFTVTGFAYYHDLHDKDGDGDTAEAGDCPVKDAILKIDGEPVIKDGELAMTKSDGSFEIEVPIGNHRISIEKNGHTFVNAVYPSSGNTYNFIEDISGLQFIDNTVTTVAGRVVGGLVESDKKLGMEHSNNNIGQASFTFESLNQKDELSVVTNAESGEYMVELLPIKYSISDFEVASNPSIALYSEFEAFDVVDLSIDRIMITEYDTIFAADNTISSIDSSKYHYAQNFIYRSAPSIRVLNEDKSGNFTGEESLMMNSVEIPLEDYAHPVFKQDRIYKSYISVEEEYTNYDETDSPIIDRVPVNTGQLTITNNLSSSPTAKTILLDQADGDTLYVFKAGIPNLLVDNNNANNSYTKTWDISFETGPHTVDWKPNDNNSYRGIVFGAKAEGTNFVTEGPQVVSHILRDPPGSASFAFYEEGATLSSSDSYSTSFGLSSGMESSLKAGTQFEVGLFGVSTETDVEASVTSTYNIDVGIGVDGEYIESTTFTQSFSTNADDEYQGMWMDVYMGRSMNMNFGISTLLTLVSTEVCNQGLDAIECVGEDINGYKIAKKKGLYTIPGGYGTEFYYTQHEIVYALIPELKGLRDGLFIKDNSPYENHTTGNKIGLNNDDESWGDDAVDTDSLKVMTNSGPSYTFTSTDSTKAQVDSIRWYNQQIRLWEEAIARNEKLKLAASPVSSGSSNISFDGGVGDVTYSYENASYDEESINFELAMSHEMSTAFSLEIGGSGYSNEQSIELSINRSDSHSTSEENTTNVGFTLSDGGLDDKYSIDILDDGTAGNGKVFKVQGGRTSCPYFGGEKTLYHEPGTELSAATIQMEQPSIAITPSSLSNVPEDEPAVFNLSLGNENPLGYIQEYSLKVVEQHNPNGAIIKIDGVNPNREYLVPAGTTINKVLTVEKGPEALDYEEIMLVFHSSCQYDPTNNNTNIGDTIVLSVSFLPGCTDVEILDPNPNWVVNTNNQVEGPTTMDVLISEYNYNYYSLDKIQLQYKESSSSDWINVETFHKEAAGSELSIPANQSFINQAWDLTDLPDGDYDLRAKTDCNLAQEYTTIYSGHVDRLRPHNFGSPSPADGILDPNDEIQINFNENINEALLSPPNFSISGILNGSEIKHDASLYFDGADVMSIPTGLNLQNKSFTIELWLNKQTEGAQSILSQGYADGDQMALSINDANQLEFTLSNTTISSTTAIENNKWEHVTVVYNKESNTVSFFVDGEAKSTSDGGQTLLADYKGEGPITVASDFVGNMHELRLWKAAKTSSDVYAQMSKTQSGKEANLLGLWPMDELEGQPQDKARARHASTTATWQVAPIGVAYTFNAANQDYLSADVSNLSFREDQDFTIELWFKSTGTNQTLLSNGAMYTAPDGSLFGNNKGWTLQLNASGKLELAQDQQVLTSANIYNDGQWHHMALVKNAKTMTSIYVDGEEQATVLSEVFTGFAGSKLAIGATPQSTSQSTSYVNHFDGSMDELRIWTKARKQEQIKRDARAKLSGNEKGLAAYYPFEYYTLNSSNLYETTHSLTDMHNDTTVYAALNMTGTGSFNSSDKPLVRMARQVESVNFTYSSNGDRVILNITDELSKVEGCILDIEVDGVYDMYGNVMSSPITWTAYINQNQLIWDEQEIQKGKTLGEPLAFTTNIVNQGGLVESFQIDNLPSWLTANPSEGLLQPNSYEQITFVVNDNLFIGDYTEDITLTGNNNYPERLELNMLVEAVQPSYELNPSDFEYTMNFIGQIKVDDIVSRDDKDILFAYVNDELRGAASPIYIADLDKYYVFMDVYSNDSGNGETLEFRLWDASEGKTHAQVSPENTSFAANTVVGTADNPQFFVASNKLRQEIPLSEGWNWLSYNLDAEDDTITSSILIPTAMAVVNNAQVATVKGQTSFSQYASSVDDWFGSLQAFDMGDMYMVKMNAADTIVYQGATLDLNEHPKTINEGWNWVGYLGQRSMGLSEALSSLNPSANDLIKSQDAFSVYFNESIGWIGSLNALMVGEGYMLKSATAQTLIYPQSTLYGGSSFRLDKNQYPASIWQVQPERYEHSMSIIAQIDHSDYYNPSLDNVLGAFAGDLCLGNIKATAINEQESLYFLTVYGNEGEPLVFNYYDKQKDEMYRATTELAFESNALIGSIENPFSIQIDIASNEEVFEVFSVAIYPNPFADYLELSYNLEKSGDMSIDIYDVMGRHMKSITEDEYQEKGSYKRQIDLSKLNQGVYFIEFKLGDDVFKKMVVKS